MAEFEDENVADSENRALEIACKQLDKFQWMDCDLHFYFSQVEARMSAVGVKKQWTKFTFLNTILPMNHEPTTLDHRSAQILEINLTRMSASTPSTATKSNASEARTLMSRSDANPTNSRLSKQMSQDPSSDGISLETSSWISFGVTTMKRYTSTTRKRRSSPS